MRETFVIGDIHGQFDKLIVLLREAGLVDANQDWNARDVNLVLLGDYCDRGPRGADVIQFLMRWQRQAQQSAGKIHALLGNHETLLLGAYFLGDAPTSGRGGTFRADWQKDGGQEKDLAQLSPAQIAWLQALPAMLLLEQRLFIHSDALFYLEYGETITEVNGAIQGILESHAPEAHERLLDHFYERFAFLGPDQSGIERAKKLFQRFGGRQIIHGHTPIGRITGASPPEINQAMIYADGLCINVDGGMYQGSGGFLYKPPALP
jgi:hypothetical protein